MIYRVFRRPQSCSREPPRRILTSKLPIPTPLAAVPPSLAPASIVSAVPSSIIIGIDFGSRVS